MFCRALELSKASATALSDYFLAVLPHQQGGSGAAAARLILASLQGTAQPAACLRAASILLQHYLSVDLSEVCTSRMPPPGRGRSLQDCGKVMACAHKTCCLDGCGKHMARLGDAAESGVQATLRHMPCSLESHRFCCR